MLIQLFATQGSPLFRQGPGGSGVFLYAETMYEIYFFVQ